MLPYFVRTAWKTLPYVATAVIAAQLDRFIDIADCVPMLRGVALWYVVILAISYLYSVEA